MSYENPNRVVYLLPTFDFGGAAGTQTIGLKGPSGKNGTLYDYGVQNATEVFAATTVNPTVAVGLSGNVDAYGEEFDLTGLALNDGLTARSQSTTQAALDLIIVDKNIPADTTVLVTCVEGTGAPTGQGQPYVVIDWEW
jgi:hypothetical protein